MYGGIFHFRWVLWFLGFIAMSCLWLPSARTKKNRLKKYCESHFYFSLSILSGSYFILALAGKVSQYWSLSLHGQDFWLFVDLLEQMKQGGFFLTRFAPQSLGFVQHGSVHPMFSWVALLPMAIVFGSVTTALIFNPLVLAGAGWMVGLLARPRWGGNSALLLSAAFLASTHVGKILMYEVHPEAAYPLLMLVILWALGLDGTKKVRWVTLIVSTLLCAGLKEDSFLILLPWVGWGLWKFRRNRGQWPGFLLSGLIAVSVSILQALSVKLWLSGQWGPEFWGGHAVVRSAGVGAFQGVHWSGVSSIFEICEQLLASKGGIIGAVGSLFTFLFSRPWLSLVIFAPWLLLDGRYHLMMLPLLAAYSLLDSPRTLWNYYSAPFLGSFWFCLIDAKQNLDGWLTHPSFLRLRKVLVQSSQNSWVLWTLGVALFLGSNSIDIYWPSKEVQEMRSEVKSLLPCFSGQGLVASPYLSLVPLEKVFTDRLPRSQEQWQAIDFVVFAPARPSFELPLVDLEALKSRLAELSDVTRSECSHQFKWIRYQQIR